MVRAQAADLVGLDRPGMDRARRPRFRATETSRVPADSGARGLAAIAGDAPFRMHPDGRGWLFVPYGLKDGPLPVHYEPRESPYRNVLVRSAEQPAVDHSDESGQSAGAHRAILISRWLRQATD